VQAQDPRGARLAVRARSAGLTAADVDRALTADRSMVITWLNRGTLHLVAAEDYWWLHALTAPVMTAAISRRLAQEGIDPAAEADRGVAVIARALESDGPLDRASLASRLTSAGIRVQGQALVHLLALASLRGLIARGPMAARQQAFVLVRDWLGAPPARFAAASPDRGAALAELARRYLAGHGPAGERDLAKWAGLPLRDARRGLQAIADELRDRDDGLAELARSRQEGSRCTGLPGPLLLGAFDPLLLGWTDREPIVGPHRQIITENGIFRPFALAGGRAVATWSIAGNAVAVTPFAPLADEVDLALRRDAADVLRFLG